MARHVLLTHLILANHIMGGRTIEAEPRVSGIGGVCHLRLILCSAVALGEAQPSYELHPNAYRSRIPITSSPPWNPSVLELWMPSEYREHVHLVGLSNL